MMLIKEVYEKYGSCWAEMARKLEFGSASYQRWLRFGYIPHNTQILIEHRSKGLLKASKAHTVPQEGLEKLKKKSRSSN